jgi:hypothetical protein
MKFTGTLRTRSLHNEHNKKACKGVMPVYASACFKVMAPERILMKRDVKAMPLEAAPITHFL